jgi:hypothetical protein
VNDIHVPGWPTIYQYAAAHRCSRCGAGAGEDCIAPRYSARRRRENQYRVLSGGVPDTKPICHAPRIDAASRHYARDVGKAPWFEDREPGRCYCTIDPCPLK